MFRSRPTSSLDAPEHALPHPPRPGSSGGDDLALAFVGTLVPETPEFYGPAYSRAAQMFQDELAHGLAQAGIDVTAIYSFEPVAAVPRGHRLLIRSRLVTSRSGQCIHLLPFVNMYPLKPLTAGLVALATLLLWAWRHRGRPRIIHCINLTLPPGPFVWLAARLSRSMMTASLLDVFRPGQLVPDTWRWRADFWQQRKLAPLLDGVMVVARPAAEDLAPGRPTCVLEGGIAVDRFSNALHVRPERRSGDPFRIVLSGTLTEYNGVDLVLEAMRHTASDVELLVAGMGPRVEAVHGYANQDSRVRYVGYLEFDQLLDLYRGADLLLNIRLTRRLDTRYFFPSKLMELLASGTPVLSTCTGPVADDYGHVLYLLNDESPAALANRIREIAAIPEADRRALGDRAQAFMFAEKTWTRQAERFARFLRREVAGFR